MTKALIEAKLSQQGPVDGAPQTQIRDTSLEEGKVVVKVWDKASKNFAIKAVNKGGQYKAVAQEGRLRMAFTVTALFADTSPESLMALLLRQNPGLPSGALLFVSRVRSSGGGLSIFVDVDRRGLGYLRGRAETELQGDPSAHSTYEGTGTTSSPQNTTPRDTLQTQITRGGPPNRATDENDNVSNRRLFNINFTQINLNKQKAATGDLALFIKNKEKPFLPVQEPHVNGKNVITRLTRDTKIIASRNTDSRPRACISYHKAITKQLWIKDSLDPHHDRLCCSTDTC